MCCYTPNSASDHVPDDAASPTKRRHLETSPPSIPSALETSEATSPQSREGMQPWDQISRNQQQPRVVSISGMTAQLQLSVPDHARQGSIHNSKKFPSRSNANGLSVETNIYTETRMLQDQTGRLRMFTFSSCSSFRKAMCHLTSSAASLHWRRLDVIHPAADPHHRREHRWVGHGLAFHR